MLGSVSENRFISERRTEHSPKPHGPLMIAVGASARPAASGYLSETELDQRIEESGISISFFLYCAPKITRLRSHT